MTKQNIFSFVFLCLVVTMLCGCQTKSVEASTIATNTAIPEPPPVVKEPTAQELLVPVTDLGTALKLMTPRFEDVDIEGSSNDSVVEMVKWSVHNLTWKDLGTLEKTSFAKVKKDSDAERGKLLCSSGSLVSIRTIKSGSIYDGLLMTPSSNIISFFAVRSSGELVERSVAKICGIVVGKYSYRNSGGGTTHSVSVIGLFDLPENIK